MSIRESRASHSLMEKTNLHSCVKISHSCRQRSAVRQTDMHAISSYSAAEAAAEVSVNVYARRTINVPSHYWQPCIPGCGFAPMEQPAIQRHSDVLARTVSDDFPLCFMFGSECVLSIVKCPCSPLDFMTL